jgi:hypothetical protein
MTAEFVAPVIDYEPQAFGGPPVLPRVSTPLPRCAAPARPARSTPAGDAAVHASAAARAAASFADAALRRILEVIDRRRPLSQLRPLLAVGLAESLLAGRTTGEPARLRRVRAQPIGPEGQAAEVSAHYTRGLRVHAIACRVEQVRTPTGPRWQVVALHLG